MPLYERDYMQEPENPKRKRPPTRAEDLAPLNPYLSATLRAVAVFAGLGLLAIFWPAISSILIGAAMFVGVLVVIYAVVRH